MKDDIKFATCELILTCAIDDYSKKSNLSVDEIRNDIIQTGAYDALFDFDTGLWTQGPDYFMDFYLKMKKNLGHSNDIV